MFVLKTWPLSARVVCCRYSSLCLLITAISSREYRASLRGFLVFRMFNDMIEGFGKKAWLDLKWCYSNYTINRQLPHVSLMVNEKMSIDWTLSLSIIPMALSEPPHKRKRTGQKARPLVEGDDSTLDTAMYQELGPGTSSTLPSPG